MRSESYKGGQFFLHIGSITLVGSSGLDRILGCLETGHSDKYLQSHIYHNILIYINIYLYIYRNIV